MRTSRTMFRPSTLLMTVVMVVLVFTGGSQAASAATGFGKVASFGAGEFPEGPGAVAVNQSSGDVYVVDHGNGVVRRYDGAGKELLGSWGVASPSGVAVDGSKGESAGDVYVLSNMESEVAIKKFDGEGKALGEVKETEAGTPFTGLSGVAVDKEGDVWVQQSSGEVDRFDGAKANKFISAAFTAPEPPCTGAFAIDENEHLYLPIGCGVEQFNTTGEDQGQLDPNYVAGVTTEVETNDVFANDGYQVSQYSAKREPLATFGSGVLSGCSAGIAINHATQHVYVADPCNSQVFVFVPVTLPVVTIEKPTGITATHADFSGTVNPEGTEAANETTWHFEYSTDKGASWSQTTGGTLEPGTGPVAVHDEATLIPHEAVEVRLAATDAGGTATTKVEPEDEFETPAIAPDVTTEVADDVTPDHAVLTGLVNPHNSATTYFFEYGTGAGYGASVPVTQDGDAGSTAVVGGVVQPVYGLTPATTYHFRLVAHNTAGTTPGEDQSFTTTTPPPPSSGCSNEAIREAQHATLLPDCRAYEMVSPPDKNGADIMADTGRTRIALDGSAASFPSLVAFGDAIGTNVATDYLSVRGADGWATHAITPRQDPDTATSDFFGIESEYDGAFSDDLSKGAFVGMSPVTPDPDVANVTNMYLRSDLRTPGSGFYQLLSACPLCASTSSPLPPLPGTILGGGAPRFVGASADFGHVIFESQQALTSEYPGGCSNLEDIFGCPGKLYEWDHGTVRLAGILPDSACGSPPCVPAAGSQAGQGAGSFQFHFMFTPHMISADGSRTFFTVPDSPQSLSGALYMRVNHTTTVQLNASERTPPIPGSQSAKYWDATSDGSRVLFTTGDALTNDAPANGDRKLYMYDASKPDSDPHNLTFVSVDHEPADPADVETVLGVSADGRYVYFAAAGQLVAGQPVLGTTRGIYAWHDGITRYIASMGGFPDSLEDATTTDQFFYSPTARVTPDGLHMIFSSSQPGLGPTGYDQGHCADAISPGCREFYLYSYASQRLTCVSCNPSGAPATASALTAVRTNVGGAVSSTAQTHPLSDDGRHVFFGTAEALAPGDVNGKADVYEYDVSSGAARLITTGTDLSDSFFMGATPSGSDVFFLTRAQLTGGDQDGNYDMYDARIGGGLVEPAASSPCSGDSCQGTQDAEPPPIGSGSALVTGAGNLAPPGAVAPQPPPKGIANAQRLAKALKACRTKHNKRKRAACERTARKRYGPKSKKSVHFNRRAGR
jgi:hypothetical protein